MRELTWSERTVGTVSASCERVLAWWRDPSRPDAFQDWVEQNGGEGFLRTETIENGVRLRTSKYKDRKGWVHETRVETELGPDGYALRNEDGSIPSNLVTIYTAPLGYKMIFTCSGQLEFRQRDSELTEVVVVHNHKVVGGTWRNRRNLQMSERENTAQFDQKVIERCQAALAPSEAPEYP